MKRLQTFDWVDYARDVAEPEVADEIRRRLEAMSSAGPELDTWNRLAALGRRDTQEVPDRRQALHLVKTMGRHYLADGAAEASKIRTLIAELAFAPQARGIGLRGGASSHHAVYTAGDYVVDVKLEKAEGGLTSLRGQLALVSGSGPKQLRVPVLMIAGDDLLQSALCDDSGEFSGDGLLKPPSDLHFLVAGDVRIQVPLS